MVLGDTCIDAAAGFPADADGPPPPPPHPIRINKKKMMKPEYFTELSL